MSRPTTPRGNPRSFTGRASERASSAMAAHRKAQPNAKTPAFEVSLSKGDGHGRGITMVHCKAYPPGTSPGSALGDFLREIAAMRIAIGLDHHIHIDDPEND